MPLDGIPLVVIRVGVATISSCVHFAPSVDEHVSVVDNFLNIFNSCTPQLVFEIEVCGEKMGRLSSYPWKEVFAHK